MAAEMAVLTDGSLIAYIYNNADEKHLDYLISRDGGAWSDRHISPNKSAIRNGRFQRRDAIVHNGTIFVLELHTTFL